MTEYFNGVLERLNLAMWIVAVVCIACALMLGLWFVMTEEEEERTKVGKCCKGFLIAIAIEVSAIIWLPTHL